ncbi:hypothetical protein PCL_02362 [Purpureocillium lilacinum]|uniref:Uncharacterized protein n=2 Tax=Purpureocillium lilacinum TaxID=33203 RepID=A0A2U3E0B5_PURLI|nr:hypothetical protein Purlil1_9742 [Purpureocillium lilacinum]PWI67961.1 hypothetical protein PCL_02362 [Purpureocillium lilacinum]
MHPALAHDAATAFAKIYGDGIKTARERLAADEPLREDEAEDVERLVGPEQPSFDAYWTKDDEENFMKEWNESEEKRRIDTVEIRNAPLHRLWKSCVRLMHCSPFAIISPRDSMQYSPERESTTVENDTQLGYHDISRNEDDPAEDGYSVTVWSQQFCDCLDMLVSHPIWGNSPAFLKLAIQYAVACRAADRRIWDMPALPNCSHMQRFRELVSSSRLATVQELHKKISEDCALEAGHSSFQFQFLGYLGSFIKAHRIVLGVFPGKIDFKVRAIDLENVAQAVNTFSLGSFPVLIHTEIAYRAMRSARSGPETPFTANSLRKLHIQSWLHESRMGQRDTKASFVTALSAYQGHFPSFRTGCTFGSTAGGSDSGNLPLFGAGTSEKRPCSAQVDFPNKRPQHIATGKSTTPDQKTQETEIKGTTSGVVVVQTPGTSVAVSPDGEHAQDATTHHSTPAQTTSTAVGGRVIFGQPSLAQHPSVPRACLFGATSGMVQQSQDNTQTGNAAHLPAPEPSFGGMGSSSVNSGSTGRQR